jgi:hypothetical protein
MCVPQYCLVVKLSYSLKIYAHSHSCSGFGEDKEYMATLCLDRVYEFTLTGPDQLVGSSLEMHPFHPLHAHVNHMQVCM